MGAAEKKRHYTFQEYLELEAHSKTRHEYQDGEVFAMAGTTRIHNGLCFNVKGALRSRLPDKCFIYTENVKVELARGRSYRYPDVVVVSYDKQEDDPLSVKFPVVIFEVLSDNTQSYDRTDKFTAYRQSFLSLQHYILVDQKRVCVECYTRLQKGWHYIAHLNLNDVLELSALQAVIPLKDIYEQIAFEG